MKEKINIFSDTGKLKTDIKYLSCGGTDTTVQEREQWHSGANFFSLAPGVIIGYECNIHTSETLNKAGFEIIKASDFIKNPFKTENNKKYLVVFPGSELARGGGGARCMTMPLKRG